MRKARGGRMILVTVTLSDWIYRSVLARSVLTLSRDYFRLRKPLERRVYEIARKHCGRQAEWKVGLETLLKKSGSTSPRRVFRKMIRDMVAEDGLPDYTLQLEAGDMVRVRARGLAPGEGPRSAPMSTSGCARWRRGSTPISSRRSGSGSGTPPAGRGSGARMRPSSPSRRRAPPGPGEGAVRRRFRARNATSRSSS